MKAQVIEISVNGTPQRVEEGTTVSALVEARGLRRDQVAVEVNRTIVPKAQHDEHTLFRDDRVEIVTLVGGG